MGDVAELRFYRGALSQLLPHLLHSFLQLRRELFVRFFRSRGCGRWINRIADSYPQWGKFLKFLAARPSFMKTLNRHRNNWRLDVNRKDRRTFLESLRRAINRPFAFGVKQYHPAVPQAEGSGAHGGNQVRVRIHHDDARPPRQCPHQAFAENVAGPHREAVAKHLPWQNTSKNDRIDKALVIRTNDEWSVGRKFFQFVDA